MRSVTILIPCFDEAAVIEAKVRNCRGLDTEGLQVNVLVVDDHSTDATSPRGQAAGARVVPNSRERGKWGAIQTGVAACDSDVVCITDADVLLEPHALVRAMRAFDDPSVGAVCGLRRMVERSHTGAFRDADGLYDAVRKAMIVFYSLLDSTPALCGPMMLVRRSLLEQVRAGGLRADDVDLPVQIRRLGYRAKACASARFLEFAPPAQARRDQALRRAAGLAQAYWHHRSALFNPSLGLFGFVAYPIECAFFFLAPVGFVAACAAALVAAIAGSAWGWLICAAVVAQEALSAFVAGDSVLGRHVQMLRATWTCLLRSGSVEGRWQPPPRGHGG